MNYIFNNILLIAFALFCYYVYRQYKDLKNRIAEINVSFSKVLDKYLKDKIAQARETTDRILKEYGKEDEISLDINRFLMIIESGENGSIIDKVKACNAINKYKTNKKIDLEKYPYIKELNNLQIFSNEDLASVDNGIALARQEYNAQAFKYNERASEMPINYLTKFFKLPDQYPIFDALKSDQYEENFEVFEEDETMDNSLLAALNRKEEIIETKSDITENDLPEMKKDEEEQPVEEPKEEKTEE
jgi:hypothetical protein